MIVGEYDGDCTVPAGDKAIRMEHIPPINCATSCRQWHLMAFANPDESVVDGYKYLGLPPTCSVGEDPDFVSPIAAVGSYTNRGQGCSRR